MGKRRLKADTDSSAPNRAYDFGINKTYQPIETYQPESSATNSHLPGDQHRQVDFKKVHPAIIRQMYDKETNKEKKKVLWKALKEWGRQYSDSLINPYRYQKHFEGIQDDKMAARIAERYAEIATPHRNLFYYQDAETNAHPNIGDGYLEPTVGDSNEKHNRKLNVYPRDFEQNRPENPPWAEGDFQSPYSGQSGSDKAVLEGNSRGKTKMGFFDTFVWCEEEQLDQLFSTKKASVSKTAKITKLADLSNFHKVGENLLVHKSDRDLWALEEDDEGNFVISRLFEGNQVG